MVTAQRKPIVVGRPPTMATLHLQMPLSRWIVPIHQVHCNLVWWGLAFDYKVHTKSIGTSSSSQAAKHPSQLPPGGSWLINWHSTTTQGLRWLIA